MNRKERIARRLEGIDNDLQFSLPSAGLVTNRLLEEDTPRYTRATDLCDPCTVPVQHFSKDESGLSDPHSSESVHMSRMETHMAQSEPTYNPGSVVTAEEESKAERIARYKAERRRQLCERYRILLDEEADTDHASQYSRMRRDPEGSERQYKGQVEGRYEVEHNANTSNVCAGKTTAQASVEQEYSREKAEVFSEQERRMNLENQKRAHDQGRMHGEGVAPDHSAPYIDTSGETRASTEQGVTAKQVASPGDLSNEQQAHNILHKQGIRVRERLARDEPSHQNAELGSASEFPVYHSHAQIFTTHQEHPKSHFPYRPSQLHHSRAGQAEHQDPGCHGYLSIGTEPSCPQVWQEAKVRVDETGSQAMAEGLLRTRKSVLPSEVRRRERSVDDVHRGRFNDADLSQHHHQGHTAPNREEIQVGEPRGRQGRWSRREEHTEHLSRLQATEEMYARAKQAQERAPNGWFNQHGTSHLQSSIQGSTPTSSGRWAPDLTKQMSRYFSDSGKPKSTLAPASQEAIHSREVVPQETRAPRDHSPVDMRVSVAQLRHSYLKSATSAQKPEQYVVP